MAKATSKAKLDVSICFEVDEDEARALDALAGYGSDEFIKAFYKSLGKHYLEPHEAGLRRFLGTVRTCVGPAIETINTARTVIKRNQPPRTAREGDES